MRLFLCESFVSPPLVLSPLAEQVMKQTVAMQRKDTKALDKDAALLASLGYKQDFRRTFSRLELFGVGFSIIGVFPSVAYVPLISILTRTFVLRSLSHTVVYSSTPSHMEVLSPWFGGYVSETFHREPYI